MYSNLYSEQRICGWTANFLFVLKFKLQTPIQTKALKAVRSPVLNFSIKKITSSSNEWFFSNNIKVAFYWINVIA